MQVTFQSGKQVQEPTSHGLERVFEKHIDKGTKGAAESSGAIFAGSSPSGILSGKEEESKGKTIEDIMSEASGTNPKSSKDMMTVLASSVSPEELGKLKENGFDLRDLDPKEMVTITDEIRATLAKAGVTIPGYNDDLSIEKLTEITGSVSAANALADAFHTYQVPMTEDNVKQAAEAVTIGNALSSLSMEAKGYLVEQKLSPTVENLYMAEHSGKNASFLAQNEIPTTLIDATLEKYGVEMNEENREMASYLISSGIGCTEENLAYMKRLGEISLPMEENTLYEAAAKGLKDYGKAISGEVTEGETLLEKAVSLVRSAEEITEAAAEKVVEEEKPVNLKNLIAAQKEIAENPYEGRGKEDNPKLQSSLRMLQEVRLSLTVSSTYTLFKVGISVDTLKLSELVEDLKAVEDHKGQMIFGEEGGDSYRLWQKTNEIVGEIPSLPEETIGAFGKEAGSFSYHKFSQTELTDFRETGKNIAAEYAKAGTRYETMMTEVRSDLGDKITKAFQNIPELLKANGLEVNEENEKATRILARNQMDVTPASVEEVKEANRLMVRVIEKMTPAATLKLIRNKENPLQLSLQELDEKLEQYRESREEASYAKFLVRLEDRNEISEEEKNSYLGIYRMLHTLEKKDSASLGAVMQQGEELSFKNLLRAVRGRNHAGMDYVVDDQFGFLDTIVTKGVSITSQLEMAFAESGSKEQQAREEELLAKEDRTLMEEATSAPEEAVELLVETEIPATMERLAAAKKLQEKKLFTTLKDSVKRGENLPDFKEHSDSILRAMDDAEEVKRAYEAFQSTVEDVLQDEMMHTQGRVDLRALQNAFRQIHLAGELAEQEHYEIPMELQGELTQVTVHMKKGEAAAEISYETKQGEHIYAKIVPRDGGTQISIYADSREILDALSERKEQLLENDASIQNVQYFLSQGLNKMSQHAENNSEDNTKDGKEMSSKQLYLAAKALLEYIAG